MAQASDDPFLLVHAYCDGELDPANALAFERRMAEDPRLAAERYRILALKRALVRIKTPRMAPPAANPTRPRPRGLPPNARRFATRQRSPSHGWPRYPPEQRF